MRQLILAIAVGSMAVLGVTSAQGAEADPCPTPSQPAGVKFFSYSQKPQYFAVPERISAMRMTAIGAHGGQSDHTAPGGHAGGVDAVIPVKAHDCLMILTGQFTRGSGHGNAGYSQGGSQGVTKVTEGNSGGAGGGSTGIFNTGKLLLVGGGGGGGGGDGGADGAYGGYGGSGGEKPGKGGKGRGGDGLGGDGGCGGCYSGSNGTGGGDNQGLSVGAGGGGGGGYKAGRGGDHGTPPIESAGGGGGAGSNFVVAGAARINHFAYAGSCPVSKLPKTCHGSVRLLWDPSTKPGDPVAPVTPAVLVLSTNIKHVLSEGLPVHHSAAPGPLDLELHISGDKSDQPVATQTVQTGAAGETTTLELPSNARKAVGERGQLLLRLKSSHPDGREIQRLRLFKPKA